MNKDAMVINSLELISIPRNIEVKNVPQKANIGMHGLNVDVKELRKYAVDK